MDLLGGHVMAERTQQTELLLAEYQAIWNERDYSKLPEIVSESFERVSPLADERVEGPGGLETFIRELEGGFSDFQITTHDQLVGEEIVMSEATFKGTHDGEYREIPPTERTVELPTMNKFKIDDGKVQKHRTYYDQQTMLEQLGITED